jgi:filamentous hemagglutinin family protein
VFKALFPWFGFSLCTLGYLHATSNSVLAQVTSDGTVNTQVTENGNTAEITGGETREDNLFHSFEDFSVKTGNEAFFNNADSISNIFSRVTGGKVSDIDGAIRANGSANLFLINPAGIIFGEGASLKIGGSFYGSSASSILFEDGEFSATDLDNPPLLTVNAPIGLGFRDQPGDITNSSVANDGSGLAVDSGKSISLLGGNVSFNGGRVTAPRGIINLGGLSTAGEISIDANNSLSFADKVAQSNVSLSNNAVVNVSSDGGGLISVNANNLELIGESLFLANIDEGLGSENSVAGTIEVKSNAFSADNKSLIHSDNLGNGEAGTIDITTNTCLTDKTKKLECV